MASLSEFLDEHLSRFLHEIPAEAIGSSAKKIIRDAVWGMIEIEPHEAVIINTPLFQRLRRISQTGFTYLVYPCAVHSRFEHSLGCLHLTGRMLNSLDRHLAEAISRLADTAKIPGTPTANLHQKRLTYIKYSGRNPVLLEEIFPITSAVNSYAQQCKYRIYVFSWPEHRIDFAAATYSVFKEAGIQLNQEAFRLAKVDPKEVEKKAGEAIPNRTRKRY